MSDAWMVRAGERGEREREALDTGYAIAGWAEVGNLSGLSDREALRKILAVTYPGASPALLSNWTGQLWRFTNLMQVGDYVVLPLKTQPDVLAIGRLSGVYLFDGEKPPGAQHRRRVEWLRQVPRNVLHGDLLDSLGSLLTVCQLTRHDAARRVSCVAEDGVDPGWQPEGATAVNLEDRDAFLTRALDEEASEPLRLSIRQLIALWGATRRTDAVVSLVESDLAENGLTTRPSISDGWLDNVVEIAPLPPTPEQVVTDVALQAAGSGPPPVSVGVGTLQAATDGVVSVSESDTLTKAMTLMVRHDFSQLAIVDESGSLIGAVSWESIGRARLATQTPTLSQASITPRTMLVTDDLLGVVGEVSRYGYVFVRDHTSMRPLGVVTVADTSIQFEIMSRPFALIEEAERRLRRRLDETISVATLRTLANKPALQGAGDLTLGAYKHVLKLPGDFKLLGWPLDHELFIELLDRVREIRNELMHFSTDPLGAADLDLLRSFVAMLRTVDPRP